MLKHRTFTVRRYDLTDPYTVQQVSPSPKWPTWVFVSDTRSGHWGGTAPLYNYKLAMGPAWVFPQISEVSQS